MAEMREERSSAEIRRDIDETRSNMDETVSALERKLTPGQILDDVLGRFRGSGGGGSGVGTVGSTAGSVAKSAGQGLGELFKNHPMPVTLIGVGLGWMVMDKIGGGPDGESSRRRDQGYGSGYERGSAARGEWDESEDDGPGLGGRLGQTTERAKEGVSSAVHRTGETVSDVGERAGEMARHAGEEVRKRADRARQGLMSFVEEQPLAAGAILFGVGLAAGLITPSTRWEDETMGRTADTVKHEGKELARDAAEAATEVAGEAVEAASEAASEKDLGSDFARKTREVVSEAGSAAKERAEAEGLTGERMGSRARRAARRTQETAETEFE